jgi:hypothetical protein
MKHLEPHDELGLPWDDLSDGRAHRLVKGRDFVRGAELVEEAAANAAVRLERVVRMYREVRRGAVFLWVQFVHHEIVYGEPCVCGGQLLQVNLNFAECSSCKVTVALLMPKRERVEHDDAPTEDEPLLTGLFGAQPVGARNGRRTTRRLARQVVDPAKDVTRLGAAYSKIVLYRADVDARRERLYGRALGPGGQPNLLVVDLPLADGKRIEDAAYPGGLRHVVWSVQAAPFQSLIRYEELSGDPVLEVPGSLPDVSADDRPEASGNGAGVAAVDQPPDTLEALEDAQLFPYARDESKKGTRLCGYARTAGGEAVLLTVRYSGSAEEQIPEQAAVRCVPLAPFGRAIDTATLFATEPGSPLPELAPAPKPGAAVDPKSDITRLGAFTNIELFSGSADETRERMHGLAVGPGDQPNLLVVEFPLLQGQRVKDHAYPGGWRHTVWSVPVGPFESFVRLDRLRDSPPDVVVEDPLANFQAAPAPAEKEERELPPARLAELEDVRLFRHGGQRKKKENFFGFARTMEGETVLVTVRYWQHDGERVPDPEDQRNPRHELRVVPVAPFGDVVDTGGLLSYRPEEDGDGTAPEEEVSLDAEEQGPAEEPAAAPVTRNPRKAERRATQPKAAGASTDAAEGA